MPKINCSNFEVDIIIKFDQPGVSYSHNGGKTWLHTANSWSSIDWCIRHIVNKYAVYHVLNPQLAIGESLCGVCASRGRVGIMQFDRIAEGREAQTEVIYDIEGEPYTDDVWRYCRYQVVKCDQCGNEESDYA